MTITRKLENGTLTLIVEGRIDTLTAPEFEAELVFDGVKELVVDLAGVEYISSAGLRLLVKSHKELSQAGGAMKIANVRPIVREVFDITGFSERFTFV